MVPLLVIDRGDFHQKHLLQLESAELRSQLGVLAMSELEPASSGGSNRRYVVTRGVVERPVAERPTQDSLAAIAEWLVGEAREIYRAAGLRRIRLADVGDRAAAAGDFAQRHAPPAISWDHLHLVAHERPKRADADRP